MARGRLSAEEMDILRQNPFVQDVSDKRIIYTNKFKFRFMKEYKKGKKPKQIFEEAGFDPQILGSKRIERAAHRWKESYASGSLGAYQDGRIRQRKCQETEALLWNISREECLRIIKEQQTEIEQLRAENATLKEK